MIASSIRIMIPYIHMEQPLSEYLFTREDYDNLQKSLLTKDIFGSRCKGEEKISIFTDHIKYYRNNVLINEYLLDHFLGFTLLRQWGIRIFGWGSIVLFKKNEYKTEWEKTLDPH